MGPKLTKVSVSDGSLGDTDVIPWMTKWRLAQQAPWREWGSLCLLTPCLLPSCPGLFFFTFLFYSLSIVAVALLFVYYTEPDACYEGKVFISLNLTLCVCVSIISVLPKVQVSLPGSARPEARPAGVWDVLWEFGILGRAAGHRAVG